MSNVYNFRIKSETGKWSIGLLRFQIRWMISKDTFFWYSGPSWLWSYGSWINNLPMQSVPITTEVLSSNPANSEVFWIQHYVIKFVSTFQQFGCFLQVLQFPPPIKLTVTIKLKYWWTWHLNTITPYDTIIISLLFQLTKTAVYIKKHWLVDITFAFFLPTWIITRLIIYPYV